jgi:(p)ppGpp synthase/HD superfamily hydrolase
MEASDLLHELAQAELPSFAAELPLTRKAISFATRVHEGQRRASDEAPFILHPLEVALALSTAGCPDRVVAAGVLHDVIEDTDAVIEEIRRDFGDPIGDLVSWLTEDETIVDPVARKEALRAQVKAAGPEAATVFAADKLSKARELRVRLANLRRLAEPLPLEMERQLGHYIASLAMLEDVIPGQPIVRQLRFELEALHILPPGALGLTPVPPV